MWYTKHYFNCSSNLNPSNYLKWVKPLKVSIHWFLFLSSSFNFSDGNSVGVGSKYGEDNTDISEPPSDNHEMPV